MAAAEQLLATPTDPLRLEIRKRLFKPFVRRGLSYQDKDFECVDYHQFEIAADLPLFRGPRPSAAALETGDYFCAIGAAQTFGRLADRPWPTLLSEALGLPVLNLGRGGAGPEAFLNPKLVDLARRARFVILQVMSGRSVGCEEYPGEILITHDGKPTGLHRLALLKQFWLEDPNKAFHYVSLWNRNYVEFYRRLRAQIDRPVLVLWISDRRPNDWRPQSLLKRPRIASFPHLIGKNVFDELAGLFDDSYEFITGPILEKTYSRITGEPCPHFGDSGTALHLEQKYYPTRLNHLQLASQLIPWAMTVV